MKKKKATLLTIPIDDIFADDVIVDLNNRVVFDTTAGYAIGYVTPFYDRVDITIKPPATVDREFRKLETDLKSFLNQKYVVVSYHDVYYRVSGGYLKLGTISAAGYVMDLSLPRVAPAEAENDATVE